MELLIRYENDKDRITVIQTMILDREKFIQEAEQRFIRKKQQLESEITVLKKLL